MYYPRFAAGLSGLVLVVLVAGCAGPSAGSLSSDAVAAAPAPPRELSGTWRGTFSWVGAYFYEDEARVTVQIKGDGTFTGSVLPNRGANNLAKPSTWAGTVVTRGNRVTLRNTEGPWPWVTLARSGDTLYGAAVDPGTFANVMLRLDRDRSGG
jgi:hypothetical protein